MPAAFLDLDDALGVEPATFQLNGQTYTVRNDVSAKLVLAMRQQVSTGVTNEVLLAFLDGVLEDESSNRLTVEWDEGRLGIKQLNKLLAWLMEQVTPRPTQEATGS